MEAFPRFVADSHMVAGAKALNIGCRGHRLLVKAETVGAEIFIIKYPPPLRGPCSCAKEIILFSGEGGSLGSQDSWSAVSSRSGPSFLTKTTFGTPLWSAEL
jgi:hypothetical protein